MNDSHERIRPRSARRRPPLLPVLIVLPLLLAITAPGYAQPIVTGASVDEASITSVVYVFAGHPRASDAGPGSRSFPKKTIKAAVEKAYANDAAGVGTRIVVYPGVYRETVRLHAGARRRGTPLVIEAAVPGRAILSGSDVFTQWTPVGDGIYAHPWPHNWGVSSNPWEGQLYAPIPSDLARRREIVFVDGVLMRQHLTYEDMEYQPGTYFVDEAADLLFVHAPEKVDLRTRLVEVGVRDAIFNANQQQQLVLRGLVFQHAASWPPNGAVYIGTATDVLIEDCLFHWNNWAGLKLERIADLTVRRSAANYNGAMGMGGPVMKNFIFEDVETSYNNRWRGGAWGQYYAPWATAGSKWLGMHDGIFRRYRANDNDVPGFWLDTDNQRIVIDSLTACSNFHLGLYFENTQGPVTVRNSVICNNEYYGHNGTAGVRLTNTRRLTFERNVVYGNARAQLFSPNRSQVNRQRCVTDWETGTEQCNTSGEWILRRNAFVGTEPSEMLADVMYDQPPEQIIDDIDSDSNLWYHPAGTGRFLHHSKEPRTFDDWKTRWNAEANSVLAAPLFADPENGDFRLLTGSPLEGWGLPTGIDSSSMYRSPEKRLADAPDEPRPIAIEGNYPNPFNPQTEIRYNLQEPARVRLEVYDALGRRVALLDDAWREAGSHQVTFDASHLGSGVYLVRLTTDRHSSVRPMHLIK